MSGSSFNVPGGRFRDHASSLPFNSPTIAESQISMMSTRNNTSSHSRHVAVESDPVNLLPLNTLDERIIADLSSPVTVLPRKSFRQSASELSLFSRWKSSLGAHISVGITVGWAVLIPPCWTVLGSDSHGVQVKRTGNLPLYDCT